MAVIRQKSGRRRMGSTKSPISLSDRAEGADIQRLPAPIQRTRVHRLAIEQIRPIIRIAHQHTGGLTIPHRYIVDHEIVLILRGEATIDIARTTLDLHPGTLVVIPPYVEHAFHASAGEIVEHIAVHFDLSAQIPGTQAASRSAAYRIELSHGQSLPTCQVMDVGNVIRTTMQRIVEAFAEQKPVAELECSSLLASVLAGLIARQAQTRRNPSDHPHRRKLEKLLDFIEQHLSRPLDGEILAAQMDLSPSRFRAIFKRQMGVSPHQYLTSRRIESARRMLADGRSTIKQIARMTGFADEFHFSKTFRQVDGLSPRAYRTQAQASRI